MFMLMYILVLTEYLFHFVIMEKYLSFHDQVLKAFSIKFKAYTKPSSKLSDKAK